MLRCLLLRLKLRLLSLLLRWGLLRHPSLPLRSRPLQWLRWLLPRLPPLPLPRQPKPLLLFLKTPAPSLLNRIR